MTSMQSTTWTDSYKVHSYEVDLHAKATVPVLCQYLQESAWNHAEHLQIGFSALLKKDLVWILSRQHVQIIRYPKWGDELTVETWPSGRDRLYCYRDFRMLDSQKELLAQATSTWFVIDLNSRRPQRTDSYLDDSIISAESLFPERAIKIPGPENCGHVNDIPVVFHDLDVNGHVNNVRYVEWLLDGFELDYLMRHHMCSLTINYLSEAHGGEVVTAGCLESGNMTYTHHITRKSDDTALCRALSQWQAVA